MCSTASSVCSFHQGQETRDIKTRGRHNTTWQKPWERVILISIPEKFSLISLHLFRLNIEIRRVNIKVSTINTEPLLQDGLHVVLVFTHECTCVPDLKEAHVVCVCMCWTSYVHQHPGCLKDERMFSASVETQEKTSGSTFTFRDRKLTEWAPPFVYIKSVGWEVTRVFSATKLISALLFPTVAEFLRTCALSVALHLWEKHFSIFYRFVKRLLRFLNFINQRH